MFDKENVWCLIKKIFEIKTLQMYVHKPVCNITKYQLFFRVKTIINNKNEIHLEK